MKRFWMLGLCLLMMTGLQAQTTYNSSGKSKYNSNKKKQQEERFADKIIFGGGLGLQLGDVTNIGITPVVGYRITDKFSAGVGFGYKYINIKDYFELDAPNGGVTYENLKANFFSASVWARYLVWRGLFAHAEYEHNFMNFKLPGYDQNGSGNIVTRNEKYQAPSVLLGAGYRQPLGEKASVNFSVLYDVLQDAYSPYGNQPFIRIQFLAGY